MLWEGGGCYFQNFMAHLDFLCGTPVCHKAWVEKHCTSPSSSSVSHLSHGAAEELEGVVDDGEQAEEVCVVVGEALSEHQAADDVGHRAAQEERGVKGLAWVVQGQRCSQRLLI